MSTKWTTNTTIVPLGGINVIKGANISVASPGLFIGDLSGNATNATNVLTEKLSASTDTLDKFYYISLKTNESGNLPDKTFSILTYNPSLNTIYANASSANKVVTEKITDTLNKSYYISLKTHESGELPDKTNLELTYNPLHHTINATATNATNATNVLTENTTDNNTHFISFKTGTNGHMPDKTNENLTYNPSTNYLSVSNLTITEKGATASFTTDIGGGGIVKQCIMHEILNYGTTTSEISYISEGSGNIIALERGMYSIDIYATTEAQHTHSTSSDIKLEGGLFISSNSTNEPGSSIIEPGSSMFIHGKWRYKLNIVKFFNANDTFSINCINWASNDVTVTFIGKIIMRLIQQYK